MSSSPKQKPNQGLPEFVKIGPVQYSLTVVPEGQPLLQIEEGKDLITEQEYKELEEKAMGASAYALSMIRVKQYGSDTAFKDTVLHEIVHMIRKQYGIRYISNGASGDKNEEVSTVVWTNAILALIVDNPQLMDFLRA